MFTKATQSIFVELNTLNSKQRKVDKASSSRDKICKCWIKTLSNFISQHQQKIKTTNFSIEICQYCIYSPLVVKTLPADIECYKVARL